MTHGAPGAGPLRQSADYREMGRTGERLATALVGYFALIILVITLSPFDLGLRVLKLSLRMKPSDMLMNIALFLPLGFLLCSLGDTRSRIRRTILAAATFSLALEMMQIFIRSRYVSPIDVLTNTAGAYAGAVLRTHVERLRLWRPALVSRTGLDIPLVGLLYLLVPQMWLSTAGMAGDPWRGAGTALLLVAAGIVVSSLTEHRDRERRFEADTLRRFIPVFAAYLVAAALWPPSRQLVSWHGAVGFLDRLGNAGITDILRLLEHVAGFTLIGYALAEWRGRLEISLASDLPRVAGVALGFAMALEIAQGVLSGPGASVLRGALAVSGALYGTTVYHLARDHVRALRGMADAPAERVAA